MWLGDCTDLEYLLLGGNRLNGKIPDLSALNKLKVLSLNDNDLDGDIPSWLGELTGLTRLLLGENLLKGEIPDLSTLSQLQELTLNNNQLSGGIPDLSALGELRKLILNNNQLSGVIPNPSALSKLEELTLNNNQLSGNLPLEWNELNKLSKLSMANNKGLKGPLSEELTVLNLSPFFFGGTNLCEPQDKTFQDWLAKPGREGTGAACEFQATDVPQSEIDALVALYKSTAGEHWTQNTGWLDTDTACTWYEVTCTEIAGIYHVSQLDLGNNNLDGFISPEFGNLPYLETLILGNNSELGDSLPANLTRLTALTAFDFSDTNLCEPQDGAFQAWMKTSYADSGKDCSRSLAEGDWQDANKTEAEDDDDDLCWAAAAANILAWGGWDTEINSTATAIMDNYEEHWENKKGSAQDAWNWWMTGAEPGDFGEYSDEWAHVDVAGGATTGRGTTLMIGTSIVRMPQISSGCSVTDMV